MLRTIYYRFGAAGRREAKMFQSFRKNFHDNQILKEQQQKTKQLDLINAQIPIPLSQAYKTTKIYKLRHVLKKNPTQLNKELKRIYNKGITRSALQYIPQLQDQIEDKTLKWQENMIMYDEVQKFNKIVFQKQETQRLLEKEKNRPQNYMSQEILEQLGETEYLILNRKQKEFQQNLTTLQNQRIDRMVQALQKGNSQQSDKIDAFQYLIQSQILNLGSDIKQKILLQINWMMNERETSNSNAQELVILDQTQEIVEELTNEIISSVESDTFDIESLKQFYHTFLSFNLESKLAMQQHIQNINGIHDYQSFLYSKFRDQDINLQYKNKKLQFWMFSTEQALRYIKFNIQDETILLKLIDTYNQYTDDVFKPEIASQLIQKLSVFYQEPLDRLKTIGDQRFRILLRKVGKTIHQLDDHYFSSSVLAITFMHPSSFLKIYPQLGQNLMKTLQNEISSRVTHLTNDYLAMVVRNLHSISQIQTFENQDLIMQEISNRVKEMEKGSIYQLESYIQYFTFCSNKLVQKYQWAMNKMYDLLLNSIQENDLNFDRISAMIVIRGLLTVQQEKATQFVQKYSSQITRFIPKFQSDSLVPLLVLISTLPIRRDHELVIKCKKRIVDINQLKEKKQNQRDVSQVIVSLAKIDTKMLYSQSINFHDILGLQLIYNRQLYSARSVQYLPYSKMLRQITLNKKAFDMRNLGLILQGYTAIGYTNKEAILELIHHGTNYDKQKFGEQELNQNLKLDELGTFLIGYSNLNLKDKCLMMLLEHFKNLQKDKQNRMTAQAFLDFVMTLHHYNLLDQDYEVKEMILKHILPLVQDMPINNCILLMYSLSNMESEVLMNELEKKVNNCQLSELLLEQRLLLNYVNLSEKVRIKEQLLMNKNVYKDWSRLQNEKRMEKMNYSIYQKYTYEEVVKQIKEELERLEVKYESRYEVEQDQLGYWSIDIYIEQSRKGIMIISEEEIIREENEDYMINGHQRKMMEVCYGLKGIELNYLIVEQYLRFRERGEEELMRYLRQYYC